MQPTANEHAALVVLLRTSGLSWPEVAAKLVATGSPRRHGLTRTTACWL